MLLGLKNISFGLLLLACLFVYKTTWKSAWGVIIIVYTIISISVVMGYLQGFSFDAKTVKLIYKTYILLFLLLWIERLPLLEKIFFPTILIALTIIAVYALITFYPSTQSSIYSFFNEKFKLMRISHRTFMGINTLGIYYTSVALLVIPLAIYLYKVLFKGEKRKTYYCASALLFAALLFSGTRACMLSAVLIVSIMIIMRIYKSSPTKKLVALVVGGVAMIYFCNILYQMLNDKKEISLQVKSKHIDSYKKLIAEHPLILILGEGAGSEFYSEGFEEKTALTEWSYAELVRWFGLFGAGIIVFIYLFPLYVFYRKRNILPYSLPIRVGYSFYLLIAGTNPLLLGSNGLLALLVTYCYAFNPKYEQKQA
jgi:hypothetical protein